MTPEEIRALRREAVNSPLFGPSRAITEEEAAVLETLVTEAPVAVFRHLGQAFNRNGLLLSIDTISREN